MKKFLLSLAFVASFAGMAFAAEYTVVAENLNKEGTENGNNLDVTVASNDDFTFTFDKADGGTKPSYNTANKDIRVYAKNTMTVKSNDGTPMTEMTFTISTQGKKRLGNITASEGTCVSNGADTWTVVWTGSATEVTFTVGEKATLGTEGESKPCQFCWTEVAIVTGGVKTTSAAPVISPKGGTFTESVEVSITAAEGAQIYYSTNGVNPLQENKLYTGPFTLTESCTVKAVAVEEGLEPSAVVEAVFTKIEAKSFSTLASLIEYGLTDEASTLVYTGEAVVTYQNGSNLYLQDNSAAILVYGSLGKTYENGVRLTGFTGKFKNYYSTYELVADAASFTDGVKGEAFPATVTDVEDVTGDIQNTYIRLNGVKFVDGNLVDGKDATVGYYNKFNITLPEDAEAHDVIGVVSYYQAKGAEAPVAQVYPIEIVGEEPPVIEPEDDVIVETLKTDAEGWDFQTFYPEETEKSVWTYDSKYGAKATGYWDGAANETEGAAYFWVDLTEYKDVTFNFEHALNYLDTSKYDRSWFVDVYAYTESMMNDEDAEAVVFDDIVWPAGTTWTYVNSGDISLKQFEGERLCFVLYYYSGPTEADQELENATNVAATWEVKNFVVKGKKGDDGVEQVIFDSNAPVEYYNLQGIRVLNPTNGIYVARQGNKAVKVLIKK